MNKEKFFIAPLVIAMIAVLIMAASVYVYSKKPQVQEFSAVVQEPDPNCNGESNEYYSLGFGIEHTYEGSIKNDMPVKIVLSCDHTAFTITGTVNQTITSNDVVDSDYDGEIYELADLAAGTEVVAVDTDYNFDGYKDLSTVTSNGQGVNQIDGYFIFLYEPNTKKFVFNKDLSAIENIYIPEGSVNEVASDAYYIDGYTTTFYSWSEGKLVEGKTVTTCTEENADDSDFDGICR